MSEETLRDMANVGESLMEAIRDYSSHPFMKSWAPADCPTEIVGDLLNALDEADGWRLVAGLPMWWAGIVTDGKHVAFAQNAEADFDGYYWAVDPEDALEWEPTHCIAAPGETLTTPPTPDRIGKDAVREALAKRTSMSTIAGGGQRPYVEIRFANLSDAHALTDAIQNRSATPAFDEVDRLRQAHEMLRWAREALDSGYRTTRDKQEIAKIDEYFAALSATPAQEGDLLDEIARLREDVARLEMERALSLAQPVDEAERLPADVRRLVIAARNIAFNDWDGDSEEWETARKELDDASEAFASRVPWDDEPAALQHKGEVK